MSQILNFISIFFVVLSAHGQSDDSVQMKVEVGVNQSAEEASLPYSIKKDELSVVYNEIVTLKSSIKELIKNKKKSKNKEEQRSIMALLVEKHKKLEEKTAKYTKLRLELKYRFPEKNRFHKREYVPLRAQSLEEIEDELDIDGQLTQLKKKIDHKYSVFLTKEKRDEVMMKKEQREKEQKKLKGDERIILSK